MDIYADILKVAKKGARKTHIVYQANLNFKVVRRYLKNLMENELIILNGEGFKTTGKGLRFLKQYEELIEPMRRETAYSGIR